MPEFNAPLSEWACHYADKGIPVFPCAPKMKLPAIKKKGEGIPKEDIWRGYGVDDATTDKETIKKWWSRFPNANIGAACGHLFDVVDLDGEAGQVTFKAKEEHNKQAIVASTRTPSGGYHIFYTPTLAPLSNGVKRLPGVDLRTMGGYVLLPPSFVIEEEKGYEGHYKWRDGQELNGTPLPDMPRWVQNAFKREANAPSQIAPEIFPDGERNDRLFRFGCSMRRNNANEIEIHAALSIMNLNRCVPPLEESEVKELAKKCCRYMPEPERTRTLPGPAPFTQSDIDTYEKRENEFVKLSSVKGKPVDWLFNRRFAKGMLTAIQGDPGEGKSTIARALVTMLTTGHAPAFWGMNVQGPRNVIWLTKEESLEYSVVPVLESMGADLDRVYALKVDLDEDGRLPPDFIFNDWGIQQLRELIEATEAAMVVIDPLTAFFDTKTDMHRQNETRAILGKLIQMAALTETVPAGIVHQSKAKNSNALLNILGSVDFGAAVRTAFLVGHDPDDRDKKAFVQTKSNLGAFADPLGFTIGDSGEVYWDEHCAIDADRINEPPNSKTKKEKTDACRDWLESELAYGQHEVTALVDRAKVEGFYKTLVYNMAAELRVSRGNQPTGGRGRGPAWWAKKGYDWEVHEWPDPYA